MARYRAAIIGTGRPRGQEGATGAAMSRFHAKGYQASGMADIVALADIRRENAEAFRTEQHCPDAEIFTDYHEMLQEVQPDVVSVVTWPHLHAEMVIACAEAGVKAVHCEKPMAPTWGAARRMHRTCVDRGTQLTFNHQRRFEATYRTARRLAKEGAVGTVLQMQAACPNLYDWGTHWFDMLNYYNGDVPAEWVMGQIDSRTERGVFGVRMEDQGISCFGYRNGVRGLLLTGDATEERGGPTGQRATMGAAHRLIGTAGVIEVAAPGSKVRLLGGAPDAAPAEGWVPAERAAAGGGWQEVPLDVGPTDIVDVIASGIADALVCLESGREPELSSHKAIRATELIFATYESSRRRARVDLPLAIEDSPFLTMLERGEIGQPK